MRCAVQGTVLNIEPTRTILLDDENGCIGELHCALSGCGQQRFCAVVAGSAGRRW
jgi:hypothetical protein